MVLPIVRKGLHLNRLDDELLVYDAQEEVVHLLNETTACVLELLRDGTLTQDEIEAQITQRTGAGPSESVFLLAVDELRKANLLEDLADNAEPLNDLTRRAMLRKMAMTGAAALLIPAVTTLSPRRAYGQASLGGVCREKKECCTVDADCCHDKCDQPTDNGCQIAGSGECH